MTIRDSSSCHLNGRRNPADARPTLRDEAVRLHRCKMRAAATTWRRRARAFRALRVSGAHQAGCDPFARKRPEKLTKAHNYRLNIPALGLRRVVSSGFLSPPLPLAADDKTHQQQPLKCHTLGNKTEGKVFVYRLFIQAVPTREILGIHPPQTEPVQTRSYDVEPRPASAEGTLPDVRGRRADAYRHCVVVDCRFAWFRRQRPRSSEAHVFEGRPMPRTVFMLH